MSQATIANVRTALPKRLEDVPGDSEVTSYLEIARLKVSETSATGDDQKWAEAYYTAYRLVKDKYPLPISENEGGVGSKYSEDPAQSLLDQFCDLAGLKGQMRIV